MQSFMYTTYLHRGERDVDAGRDEAGVVGQELNQLGRRRTLRRRLVPAGFQQSLSAKIDVQGDHGAQRMGFVSYNLVAPLHG